MSEETGAEQTGLDWRVIGLWVSIAAIIAVLLYQAFTIRNLNSQLEDVRAAAREELSEANRQGAADAATTLAAALEPLIYMLNQGESVNKDRIRAICETIAGTGRFDLVAVTDEKGTVIHSSDLTLNGKPFEALTLDRDGQKQVEGRWEAHARIMSGGARLGVVVVRTE